MTKVAKGDPRNERLTPPPQDGAIKEMIGRTLGFFCGLVVVLVVFQGIETG